MKIVNPSVEMLWVTPNPEEQIEIAGRTCYKSEGKIAENSAGIFCKKMVESGHHAMLEHACASFRIITDRGITHEIVRHRIASYAQESTRYCNYSTGKFNSEVAVIMPPNMSKGAQFSWDAACVEAETNYMNMLAMGCTPQIARAVSPTCLKAELVMTANFREWRHFIQLRGSLAAHPQIRPIAREVWNILMAEAPNVFADLGAGL